MNFPFFFLQKNILMVRDWCHALTNHQNHLNKLPPERKNTMEWEIITGRKKDEKRGDAQFITVSVIHRTDDIKRMILWYTFITSNVIHRKNYVKNVNLFFEVKWWRTLYFLSVSAALKADYFEHEIHLLLSSLN